MLPIAIDETLLSGVMNPLEGSALVVYYAPVPVPAVRLRLSGTPWYRTGGYPFTWQLLESNDAPQGQRSRWPGVGPRSTPTIRILADRSVWIRGLPRGWPAAEGKRPIIQIFRLPTVGTLSTPDEPIDLPSLLGHPYYVMADGTVRDYLVPGSPALGASVHVVPGPLFTRIARGSGDEVGDWSIILKVPAEAPAGFTFHIDPTTDAPNVAVRVIHSRLVIVMAEVTVDPTAMHLPVFLSTGEVPIHRVPAQGSNLGSFQVRPFRGWTTRASLRARQERAALETTLAVGAVVPGASLVTMFYSLGQFLFASIHGRDMWGETTDQIGVSELGVAAFLEAAGLGMDVWFLARAPAEVVSRLRSLEGAVDGYVRQSSPAAEAVLNAIRGGPPDSLRAIIGRLSRGAISRGAALHSVREEILRLYNRILPFLAEGMLLAKVFNDSLTDFRSSLLREGYRRYRAGGGARSPVEWAMAQTSGRYKVALQELLGEGFGQRLRRIAGARPIIDADDLRHFERWGALPDHYRDHVMRNRGFGRKFEVDHLFEQRFHRHVEHYLEPDDLFSLIVPRNPDIASQIVRSWGSSKFFYIHSVKTAALRRLIPNGAERVFSLQQWWDAHVYVYRSVGVDQAMLSARLEPTFREVAEEAGEVVALGYDQSAEMFTPEAGWPSVLRALAE